MKKFYITAQALLEASFVLAHKIFEDGYRPDFIVGVWRGGTPVGIAVQEYYEYRGVSTDHHAVRTKSYVGINDQSDDIRVHGLHYLVDNVTTSSRLLIVDDVFDSGRSVEALVREIERQCADNPPADIRVACAWYKPGRRKVAMQPDYYTHANDDWLVFPHELHGLSRDEVVEGKTDLAAIKDLF
jgi:hypoxanthine phosphoribosyltransferase